MADPTGAAAAQDILAARARAQQPPPGFALLGGSDGLIAHNGPLLVRTGEGPLAIGCRIMPHMCNPLGGAHGGWLATLCDVALPVGARLLEPALTDRFLLTVSLSLDYLGAVALGDWLQVEPRVLRTTRRMAFVEGLATVGGTVVVRTSGVFRLGPPAPPVEVMPLDGAGSGPGPA